MNKGSYKQLYDNLFFQIKNGFSREEYYESALLSYMHKNKLMSWLFWQRIFLSLQLAKDIKGKKVLDFGCGIGVTFKYFSDKSCEIFGCDKNSYKIASIVAESLNVNASIVQDITELQGHQFDFIFALDVLEHIHEVDYFIEQFRRLSKPNVNLIISGPTENLFYHLGRKLSGFPGDYHVRNIYDIESRLAQAGFKRIQIKSLYQPFPLFRLSGWCLKN